MKRTNVGVGGHGDRSSWRERMMTRVAGLSKTTHALQLPQRRRRRWRAATADGEADGCFSVESGWEKKVGRSETLSDPPLPRRPCLEEGWESSSATVERGRDEGSLGWLRE